MAKASVETVYVEETQEVEYDVEVSGSDAENNGAILFYCANREDAVKLAKKFNKFLQDNKHLYER